MKSFQDWSFAGAKGAGEKEFPPLNGYSGEGRLPAPYEAKAKLTEEDARMKTAPIILLQMIA